MNLMLTFREKWSLRAIYIIVTVVTFSALAMAFDHARNWSSRHSASGDSWEGWAFAVMIELPAVMGLLLLQIWGKIASGRKRTIPRLLLGASYSVSAIIQQAYAGPHASVSTRIVAGLPTVVAGIFVEIMFMLMGLVDEVKADMAAEQAERLKVEERPRVGLGDIAPPPPMSPRHDEPMSPPDRPDMSPPTAPPTSPRHDTATRPDTPARVTPSPRPSVTATTGATSVLPNRDIPQATAHVTPDMPPIYVAPTRHPDTGQPEGDTGPDVTPDTGPDVTAPAAGDVAPDGGGGQGDTAPDVTPDTQPDMTNPLWVEAAVMRRRGDTVAAIAKHFGKSTRTIQRWNLPEPDSTKPANGHAVPDLAGADR